MNSLADSKKYVAFIADRDRALEQLHQNAQLDISRITHEALTQIENVVSALALRSHESILTVHSLSNQFEDSVDNIFGKIFSTLVSRFKSLRKNVLTLTYLSELEAMGQATQRPNKASHGSFKKAQLRILNSPTILGDQLENRIWYDLVSLRYRITQVFSLGLVQRLDAHKLVQKVKDEFPKLESYKRPPRLLKPLKEAHQDEKKKDFYDYSFIDDSDWDLAVAAYKDAELPLSRFDRSPDIDPEAGFYKYNWELEQELTEDFVKQVRDSQVEAATELGIDEFGWIAIIDNRTDNCCLMRNGKTTSEIEEMLAGGQLDPSECDASTPPAHFNCRCKLAPIASQNEVEGPNWKSFGEWLDS